MPNNGAGGKWETRNLIVGAKNVSICEVYAYLVHCLMHVLFVDGLLLGWDWQPLDAEKELLK